METMDRLLIIDDEKGIRDLLSVVFKKEQYSVSTALSAESAIDLMNKDSYDIILTDIKLPGISGMELLKRVLKKQPQLPVVMITAYGTIKQAVDALKAGAVDYLVKPFNVEELKIVVTKALEKKRLIEENLVLKKQLNDQFSLENMVGGSKEMKVVCDLIRKIAVTDSTVLIQGESGTGKELAAKAIHSLSHRRQGRFVSINCGALPENLLESELFGHVKGSFTGAIVHKKGLFEVAEKGTLLLDEVGEMSSWTQVKLLRAIQERKIRRVGGTEEISVDARIIASTNQDPRKKIAEGAFREDLFYRLNIISLEMPPLRKRKEDIPLLVAHFLMKYCKKMGRKHKRIIPEVMNLLEAYPWPGNVRELENVVERIVAIEERETITEECLPEEIFNSSGAVEAGHEVQPGFNLNETLDDISCRYIQQALHASGGNLKEAAFLLGINYRSLRYQIDKYGLKNNKRDEGTDSKGLRKMTNFVK